MRAAGTLAILGLLLAATALVAQDFEAYLGRVEGDEVRIRSGPSLGHRVLELVSTGEKLIVTGKEQDWLRVAVPGGVPCWIREDLLTVRGDEAIVKATRVLMRPTAGQDYLPLDGRLEKGEKLRVLDSKTPEGDTHRWYRVLAPERVPVYIHAEFVKRVGPVPEDRTALVKERAERLAAAAKEEGGPEATARRDDALRARVREVQKKLDAVAAKPGGVEELAALKEELQRILTEADFRVTKLEAAGVYKDVLLLEKRRELDRARTEAELTAEQLKAKIREAEDEYEAAMERLRKMAPLKEMQFSEVGWVHLRSGVWVLEKGGIPLCILTSKLFDVKDFAGKKVGVRGPRVGEDPVRGLRILEAEAIEIFD